MKFTRTIGALTTAAILCLVGLPATAQVIPRNSGDAIVGPILSKHQATNFTSAQYNIIDVPAGRDILLTPQYVGGASTNTGTVGFRITRYYGGASNTYSTNSSTTWLTLTSTANGTTGVRDPIVLLSTTLGPATQFAVTGMTNNTFGTDVTGGSLTLSNVFYQFPTK